MSYIFVYNIFNTPVKQQSEERIMSTDLTSRVHLLFTKGKAIERED